MPEYGFLPLLSRIGTESSILDLHGKIRVGENPYSGIFYRVIMQLLSNIGLTKKGRRFSKALVRKYNFNLISF